MILNVNQPIPEKLYVNRRNIHEGIIDTSQDLQGSINIFMDFMKAIDKNCLPSYISEETSRHWHIEKILEETRKDYFPAYPSRLSCTFLSDRFYFNSYRHEATILKDSKVIKCDMAIINFLRSNPHALTAKNILLGYWQGKTLSQAIESPYEQGSLWEYLVEGEVYLSHIND